MLFCGANWVAMFEISDHGEREGTCWHASLPLLAGFLQILRFLHKPSSRIKPNNSLRFCQYQWPNLDVSLAAFLMESILIKICWGTGGACFGSNTHLNKADITNAPTTPIMAAVL